MQGGIERNLGWRKKEKKCFVLLNVGGSVSVSRLRLAIIIPQALSIATVISQTYRSQRNCGVGQEKSQEWYTDQASCISSDLIRNRLPYLRKGGENSKHLQLHLLSSMSWIMAGFPQIQWQPQHWWGRESLGNWCLENEDTAIEATIGGRRTAEQKRGRKGNSPLEYYTTTFTYTPHCNRSVQMQPLKILT